MRTALAKATRQTITVEKTGTIAAFISRPVVAAALGERRGPARRKRVGEAAVAVPARSAIVFRGGVVSFR